MTGVRLLTVAEFLAVVPDMREVFRQALEYRSVEPRVLSFPAVARDHARHGGFRAAAAYDHESLVGFAYGHHGERGQWWHEQVARALGRDERHRWLDHCFELVELHVLPSHQGRGLGGALHDLVLDGVPRPTAVLSTPAREGRAMALYRARGWTVLAEGMLFEGITEPFRILGLRLPPAPSPRA